VAKFSDNDAASDPARQRRVDLSLSYYAMDWRDALAGRDKIRFRSSVIRHLSQPERAGNTGPPLLVPNDVEEFLLAAKKDLRRFPTAPSTIRESRTRPMPLVHRYSIGAVIFWNSGGDPAAVKAYFSKAFGVPTKSVDGVLVWLTDSSGCRS